MTADEIRKWSGDPSTRDLPHMTHAVLVEIAAQLAELNMRLDKLTDDDNFSEGRRGYLRVTGSVGVSSSE